MIEQPYIIAFPSVHHVMKAEGALLGAGVAVEIIPLPKTLAPDCGLALRIDGSQLGQAQSILSSQGVTWTKTYDATFRVINREEKKAHG